MKKKILSALLLVALVVGMTACGNSAITLDKIAENFNNLEDIKQAKEYGYDMTAKVEDNKLVIDSSMSGEESKFELTLDGNILSNDKLTEDDMLPLLYVIDSIGQASGYEAGELLQNFNDYGDKLESYTVEKEGFQYIISEDSDIVGVKFDLSKKIPLIDAGEDGERYLTPDDLDILAEIKADNQPGNQSGKVGNIAFDAFISDDESSVQIGQFDQLDEAAYKSIVSALQVMYDENVANKFQELYPEFIDGKTTVEAFTIETHYEIPDLEEDSLFYGSDVVLVSIKNADL